MTADQVLASKGRPDRVARLGGGRELWTYDALDLEELEIGVEGACVEAVVVELVGGEVVGTQNVSGYHAE